MSTPQDSGAQELKRVWVDYAMCLIISLVLAFVVLGQTGPGTPGLGAGALRIAEQVILVLVALNLLLAWFLPRFITRSAARQVQANQPHEKKLRNALFIRALLLSAPVAYGLVFYFIGGDRGLFVLLVEVAVFGLLIAFPTRRRWNQMLGGMRRRAGARGST